MLVFAAIYLVLLSNGGVLNYLTVAVDSVVFLLVLKLLVLIFYMVLLYEWWKFSRNRRSRMLADLGFCRTFSRNREILEWWWCSVVVCWIYSDLVLAIASCWSLLWQCLLVTFVFALPIWVVKLQDPVPHLLLVLLLHAVMLGFQNMKDCDTEWSIVHVTERFYTAPLIKIVKCTLS